MNLASLTPEEKAAIEATRIACWKRYYQNMTKATAMKLKSQYERNGRPTAKSRLFVKRVNKAKGQEFIK